MTLLKNSQNLEGTKINQSTEFGQYRFGLVVSVACIIAFIIWSSIATINLHVRGIGKIIPSGKVRSIQHLEGGIINSILIKEGQIVKQGDVLFQLENVRAESERKEIEVALSALSIKKTRLQSERDFEETVKFLEEIETNYPEITAAEKELFKTRTAEFHEKQQVLKKQMNQKVLKLDEIKTTIANITKEMANAQQQLNIRKGLLEKGAISRSQFIETDSRVKNFKTRIAKLKKESPVVKSEISEILSLLEETKQNWRYKIIDELNKVELDIQKLEERIKSYTDTIDRKDVISPINGIVKTLAFNTIGGVVKAGELIAEIIPVKETLIIEANISTEDRGKVWVGLPVIAKITAYDYSVYGGVDGKLTFISADSFIDPQNNQYYQVRVEIEKAELSANKPILPGMAVEINILANKISILDAILRPFRKLRDNAIREI